ncbi:MAG: DNA topoisomerase IV [Candidatus Marinimicrobia bacterium]|nr:DNA topoisomerase IV [Candidatus Neomarinimicrobiota bacterium]|tara:strand:+ start:31687 stop:33531 length:1845 start_codon:yes stop_codon:yes gene_type:complete
MNKPVKYDEDSIKSLSWKEHIRKRPGMYIGKLGNGSSIDDGIYILIKEVIDNSIDEHIMGYGNKIEFKHNENVISIRDYGRGIPLGKVEDCASKINTGGKYDSEVFKKSVGLNGVGIKAVNALSSNFEIYSIRDGKTIELRFSKGELVDKSNIKNTDLSNGTFVRFTPDNEIFKKFNYIETYIEEKIMFYTYLNAKLSIIYNNKKYKSDGGLKDLLKYKTKSYNLSYPIIHLKNNDIEVSITHSDNYGEEYYSFVNGQYTAHGGTHLMAFRESFVRSIRDFYKKDFDVSDIRASIVVALSIRLQNPVFESQTKNKLGSIDMAPNGPTIKVYINDFFKTEFDNFLHKNPEISKLIFDKIIQSEKERKDIAGIKKIAKQKTKKANLHNKKLRDCKYHYNDKKIADEFKFASTLFITEGDSASGSITKTRDVKTQAVFSLRGKPLNSYGLTKKIVYQNEEFNLLQHALNIEEGVGELRYNKVVIATDADVDGMHIRLLILTFFLQFYPELVRNGHVYILETPLFRIRNKVKTLYAYSENEKTNAIDTIGGKIEITRFKGLGEISPHEFKDFIGDNMKLEPVIYNGNESIKEILSYYMGKNTQNRQEFIIDNLKESDI